MSMSIVVDQIHGRRRNFAKSAAALASWGGIAAAGAGIGGLILGLWTLSGVPVTTAAAAWSGTAAILFLGLGLTGPTLRSGLVHIGFAAGLFWLATVVSAGSAFPPALGPVLQAAWATATLANDAERERHGLLGLWAVANLVLAIGWA